MTKRGYFEAGKRSVNYFLSGDQFRDEGDWEKAAQEYRSGLKENPKAFPYWVQLGHALKESGKLGEASDAYCEASSIRVDDEDLHVQMGHVYKEQGHFALATDHYLKALRLGSRDQHALNFIDQHATPLRTILAVLERLLKMRVEEHDNVPRLNNLPFGMLILDIIRMKSGSL